MSVCVCVCVCYETMKGGQGSIGSGGSSSITGGHLVSSKRGYLYHRGVI